ncbi:hypothetical protein R69927_04708 [Paraburkholderia domus]|jgi:Protein of unknown function (DUF3443).|uniref:DUF3443 domain-containing protein n=2 Tax=Paraburkholderia domus TaxID=2793075 RepID=A0A9N8MWC0_9BURK|nr:hypothetical protein R70006_06675 [Paraburkholderia domus]CAE6846363.1 hypothetical protein R70199_00119 [Paraburkholderia domus]CAE6883588.1 hypothetical protein R70211_02274 [Paraburkholderia domus]CAE6889071.1 hypothetical protein R69927_04708 [Paraburkholderia domus]
MRRIDSAENNKMTTINKTFWGALVALGLTLSACGGGSDGNGSKNSGSIPWSADPDWIKKPDGSGNAGNSGNTSSNGSNTVPIRVDNSMGSINMLSATITVCVPGAQGTSQCTTVDRMLVDTGSVGVRIMASALPTLGSQLLTQVGAVDDASGVAPIAECMPFGSGTTWGSVKRADVKIGSRTASNIPIQLIGDGAYTIPSDCVAHGGPDLSSVERLGANGILGIGYGTYDSKDALTTALPGNYYYCTGANACFNTRMLMNKEVMNPVAAFSSDNNGTIIRLPKLPAGGLASVTGELVFGIGTQSNNALPSNVNVLTLDEYGEFTTQYQGRVFNWSAIDSGTNGFAFQDDSIPTTSGWYTPLTALSLAATMESTNGKGTPVNMPFSIDNAIRMSANGYAAYENVGWYQSNSKMFMWGLPFFYGRSVYTTVGNGTIGKQSGPFVAF